MGWELTFVKIFTEDDFGRVEENVEVKRSYIFGLIYGYDNKMIDAVREIPKGELNSHLRKIDINELLDHRKEQRKLEKRWRY